MAESSEISHRGDKLREVQDQFIIEWGRMSSRWGINRTMAQIHALLFVTGEQLGVDEIISRLHISRGNASMTLRDLMDWGLVRRSRQPGERHDTYSCDTDAWQMFARVIRERKRREIDPTETVIRECLANLESAPKREDTDIFQQRLTDLLAVFELIDMVYKQVFRTDQTFVESIESLRTSGQLGG